MNADNKMTLKEKIISEMFSDYHNALDKNFDSAKNLIKITNNGNIEVINKISMNASDQILLYLIGVLYAQEAGLSEYGDAGNHELQNELGLPKGTILPALKDLRDKNKIKRIKRDGYVYHEIPINRVEKTLLRLSGNPNKI